MTPSRGHEWLKMSTTMLRSGKYKGHTFGQVAEIDRKYCAWLLTASQDQSLPRDLKKFALHLEKVHGGLLQLGRHKGEWFNDVWKTHPDYVEWAAEITDPGDGMRSFSEYAKKRIAAEVNLEEPPESQKKPHVEEEGAEGAAEQKACVVCADRPAVVAFVPCGHMIVCSRCASLVEAEGCPLCRSEILMSMKIYS